MTSIPVPSSEPGNAVTRTSFYTDVVKNSEQISVLQKAGTIPTPDIIVQTVTNGDTDHAPSGGAVFDYVADEIDEAIVQTVTNGDTGHTPSGEAVYEYVEAKRITAVANINFPSIAAFATSDLTITVTGAAVNDAVALGPPTTFPGGMIFSGWVSAANTVTVRAYNSTGVAINPAAADWRATVFK
jgi:hypothetical protein